VRGAVGVDVHTGPAAVELLALVQPGQRFVTALRAHRAGVTQSAGQVGRSRVGARVGLPPRPVKMRYGNGWAILDASCCSDRPGVHDIGAALDLTSATMSLTDLPSFSYGHLVGDATSPARRGKQGPTRSQRDA
jgi:hypothetical protein